MRAKLLALEKKYAHVPKKPQVREFGRASSEQALAFQQRGAVRSAARECLGWVSCCLSMWRVATQQRASWMHMVAAWLVCWGSATPKQHPRRRLTRPAVPCPPSHAQPHPDIGCWWTLYDYGLEAVKGWKPGYVHPYPGEPATRGSSAAAQRAGLRLGRCVGGAVLVQAASATDC